MNRFAIAFLAALSCAAAASAQVNVSNDVTSNTTWTANNEYRLDGLIFVNAGVTLTIEPGTVIKGLEQGSISTGDGASALIVRRGARLVADGTADAPIVFTTEFDDVDDPDDTTQRDRGLWGGVILLGRATTNQPTTDNQIEGIPDTEDAQYGGTDDDDDSGVLRYVSIRHGGFSISGVEGDEINGLTLGAVGRGTTIEHIEVFANLDDGYEFFGGTVNTRYLAAAFCADDSFDYDQGFRGRGQFWFSIHDTDIAGRAGEHDGGDAGGDDAEPLSRPVLSNVTYIGSGETATVPDGDSNDLTFAVRDAAGGLYFNSVFTDFPGAALNIEDLPAPAVDSRQRLEDGDLGFFNSLFFGYGAGDTLAELVDGDFADAEIEAENDFLDPELGSLARTQAGQLDPRPAPGGPAAAGADFASAELGGFFEEVNYLGAFEPGEPVWLSDWSALDATGFLSGFATPVEPGTAAPRFALEAVYPNPVQGQATVRFALDRAQPVELAVYDVMGRRVSLLASGTRAAGPHAVAFDGRDLPGGVYVFQLTTESGVATAKAVVTR